MFYAFKTSINRFKAWRMLTDNAVKTNMYKKCFYKKLLGSIAGIGYECRNIGSRKRAQKTISITFEKYIVIECWKTSWETPIRSAALNVKKSNNTPKACLFDWDEVSLLKS